MRGLLLACSILFIFGVFNRTIIYYIVLSIIVFLGAISVVVSGYNKSGESWLVVFGLVALTFNSFIPVYLYNKSFFSSN